MGATVDPRSPIGPVRTTGMERSDRFLPGRGPSPCCSSRLGTRFASPSSRNATRSGEARMIRACRSKPTAPTEPSTRGNSSRGRSPEEERLGLRQNLRTWIDLRNSVAHPTPCRRSTIS